MGVSFYSWYLQSEAQEYGIILWTYHLRPRKIKLLTSRTYTMLSLHFEFKAEINSLQASSEKTAADLQGFLHNFLVLQDIFFLKGWYACSSNYIV